MLMLTPTEVQETIYEDWPEWNHPDNHAFTNILAFVSGMPRRLRDGANLVAVSVQGWFDESGKEGWPREGTSPVFLLAGYVAPVRIWAPFADDWDAELNRAPKLTCLHTKDAYGFENQFGSNSACEVVWGPRNEKERDKRLMAFAQIIENHLQPIWSPYGPPDRLRCTWMLSHDEYDDFKEM